MRKPLSEKARIAIGILLFAVFAAMFIIGSRTTEVALVVKKATSICLECIGIGK